jgi:hypothetical protein
MDLSNEQILQIIDFIVNEDDCDTGVFAKFISESNYYSIEGFSNLIKTTKRIFNLDRYDIDFLFHVYNDNYDLILKDNLNAENMVIPVRNNYTITTKCMYNKSGFEYYESEENIYSLKSIYWKYDNGSFYPNDGKLVDDDSSDYEMQEWEIYDSSIKNNVKESKEERLKKLLMMKEIVDRKIKELL